VFEHIVVGLDGSALAEEAIPIARCLSRGRLTFLRVVSDPAELTEGEQSLRACARLHGAKLQIVVAPDPASAICAEVARIPGAIPVIATHGRTAWTEAIMGSVALRVLRESTHPVMLFRPTNREWRMRDRVKTIAALLDGSKFAEQILPHAIRAARSLSAGLLLLQSLPVESARAQNRQLLPPGDIMESSYLHRKAAEIETRHELKPEWDVLHGDPGPAICRSIQDMPGTILAMTTHARPAAERAVMGSVAAYCIRHAGTPLLLYWPRERQG
jgi:nucleotide-binding universal stress UspA family protein